MLGIQTYGIFTNTPKKLQEVLPQLRSYGYDALEPCLSFQKWPGWERAIWPLEQFDDNAAYARKLGYEIPSVHLFADGIVNHAEVLIRLAKQWGIQAYVVKLPQDLSENSLKMTANEFIAGAEILHANQVELWLHNEQKECSPDGQGNCIYAEFLKMCQGKVQAEVDVGWIYAGGMEPVGFLDKYASVVRAVHLKDFVLQNDKLLETGIGLGNINMKACIDFARSANIPLIVDQEHFPEDKMAEWQRIAERCV